MWGYILLWLRHPLSGDETADKDPPECVSQTAGIYRPNPQPSRLHSEPPCCFLEGDLSVGERTLQPPVLLETGCSHTALPGHSRQWAGWARANREFGPSQGQSSSAVSSQWKISNTREQKRKNKTKHQSLSSLSRTSFLIGPLRYRPNRTFPSWLNQTPREMEGLPGEGSVSLHSAPQTVSWWDAERATVLETRREARSSIRTFCAISNGLS